MTSKTLGDSDIGRASAELDSELEQIFEEMDAVLKESSVRESPAAGRPAPDDGDDIALPDDFELPPTRKAGAAPAPFLSPDFERSVSAVSPAAAHEILELELELEPAEPDEFRSPRQQRTASPPPARDSFQRPGRRPRPLPLENELPEAEVLPDDFGENPKPAATVAQLSPEALARLIEEAVERGFLKALRKR